MKGFLSSPDSSKLTLMFLLSSTQAVDYLGPDLDPLKEDLFEIGQRHKFYGVHPRHLASLEGPVIWSLEETIGEGFSAKDRQAWKRFFNFITKHMSKGLGLGNRRSSC